MVASVTSYSQFVETEMKFPDRTLNIIGTYDVDTQNKRFASYSTTTLLIARDTKGHIFTHQDIAIGDDVYTKVETYDNLLTSSIQSSAKWQSFKSNAIPRQLASIAIAGPIQDNLSLLAENGKYLTFAKKQDVTQWGTESLLRYTFTLSSYAFEVSDGPLNAAVKRIGKNGMIDVWIDPTTFEVRHLLFTNPPYTSTTTISRMNTPLPIVAPVDTKS